MEKIFIKERINIVDYNNKNQGLIYSSGNPDIDGGAVNIELESDVGGWHELTFDMPNFIVQEGELVPNPLMKNLFPLAKLQYTRIIKEGDEEKELILYFIVQPQVGSRDESGIVLQNFTCIDYPRHYLSKAKVGLTIGEDTIDEELSLTANNEVPSSATVFWIPADVQMRTDFNTIAEISAWGDAKPGAFAYIASTGKAYRLISANPASYTEDAQGNRTYTSWYELGANETYTMDGTTPVPAPVWCPDWGGYPLAPDPNTYEFGDIDINDIDEISVQFYWDTVWLDPNKTYGRYEGILYEEGSRLVYSIYETRNYDFPENFMGTYSRSQNLDKLVPQALEGKPATAYVLETLSVWQYVNDMWEDTHKTQAEYFKVEDTLTGSWDKLDEQLATLCPNNAENYLKYILRGTGWTVGTVDKIYVDNGTIEMDETGVVTPGQEELRAYLTVDGSNAYNGISELCDVFMVYPRFDHVNKTVSLQSNPGMDNNLEFKWKENLATTTITQDGEKAVSKLWVYGGEDLISQQVISDCNRMNPNYYLAEYTSLEDLEDRAHPQEGSYAKIAETYTWAQLCSGDYSTVATKSELPATGSLGQTYYVTDEVSFWTWNPDAGAWYDTYLSNEPADDATEITLEQRYDYENGQWVNKGQFYHWYEPVSPFADNYIMDFRYFLDRGLITQEQVDDIKYNYVLPMSRIGRKRWPLYEEYQKMSMDYDDASNSYDASKICRDAVKESLVTTYSIRQYDDNELINILETNVKLYPPGADIGANGQPNVGWTKSEIIYSEASAYPTAQTFADIPNVVPNPTVGSVVRVTDEAAVYYYNQFVNFDDTISAYIGWETSAQVDAVGFDGKENTLLRSPDGKIEAAIRGLGYFDEFRNELSKTDRPSLAPWYNPPMSEDELPEGSVIDPDETSGKHKYYSSLERYVTEQMAMDLALERMKTLETQMTLNLEKQELLYAKLEELNAELREKYGDFIVEGTFTDEDIVWRYNLWYAGLEALELYHRPLVTYELGVTDISGLPEYRTMTEDIYHDIVYRMSKPELVLPDPGDYCYVTDNTLGLVREKANVTSITRNLSNPSQNQITIATVDTNTEDLIGKLVTAANTIYSKEQIYNRSSIITEDGTISQDSMVGSLEDNSGKFAFMSNSGTVILGESGITTVDRENGDNRMQYTGKGIFASTNGGVTWKNIVSAGQISINNLSAGTIDSNVISVTNMGHTSSITIDGAGITARKYGGATSNPDIQIQDPDVSFFLDASTGNAYFKGMIQAGAGDIGGWYIGTDALTRGNVGMNSNSSAHGGYAFWAGSSDPASAPFWVKHNGEMQATNGHFTGAINGGSITGTTINNGNGTFRVDADGNLTATSANIAGVVNASSGSFTGTVNATSGVFQNVTVTESCTVPASTITGVLSDSNIPNLSADKITSGYLSANRISGGTITSSDIHLNRGTVKLCSTGRVEFTNGVGFFSMGPASSHSSAAGVTHPYVSALNVATGSGGIVFVDSGSISSVGNVIGNLTGMMNGEDPGMRLESEGQLRIQTNSGGLNLAGADSLRVEAVGGRVYIQNNSNVMTFDGHKIIGQNFGNNTEYAQVTIYQQIYLETYNSSSKAFYHRGKYSGGASDNDEIATVSDVESTLSVKENVEKKDLSDVLDIMSNVDIYDYKYIDGINDGKQDYGYIIDYLEQIPGIEKYLTFYPQEIDGIRTKQVRTGQLIRFLLSGVSELSREIKEIKKSE